jgi:hypothetical protein
MLQKLLSIVISLTSTFVHSNAMLGANNWSPQKCQITLRSEMWFFFFFLIYFSKSLIIQLSINTPTLVMTERDQISYKFWKLKF